MAIRAEIIDEIIKNSKDPKDFNGIWKEFQKAVLERALQGEMTNHLGYEKNEKGKNGNNSRNGTTSKTVVTDNGDIAINVPRDRQSEFEPQIIAKGQRRF